MNPLPVDRILLCCVDMKGSNKPLFLIHYKDPVDGKIISLKAHSVNDSSLGLSFVAISDFFFESSQLVIKPSEEQLMKKLEHTKSLHLSIYSIISIEELSEKSLAFKVDKSKLLVLPSENSHPN